MARVRGELGTPEFMASYNRAIKDRRTLEPGRFKSLVVAYKASPDYTKLADSTRNNWSPWPDRNSDYFGDLRIAQFDPPEKIRPVIRRWRNQWADKPRTADYGMQVLSCVLAHTLPKFSTLLTLRGTLACVCCCGWHGPMSVRTLYGSPAARVIPLYDDLRDVLARIPRRSTAILTNQRGRPWTAGGFATAFQRAKHRAKIEDRDLHFHDLRGTAATRFYVAGLSIRVIAEILAWSEDQVEKIIRRYVARDAATQAVIRQLNEARRRT